MAQTLRSLPLSTGASQTCPVRDGRQSARRNPLWVAVHMPGLALEALAIPDTTPTVVVEPENGQHRVIAANPRAQTHGIAPGLKLSAALALSRTLAVLNRSPEAEHLVLASLAQWARRITPAVSLAPPHALLLEIRGSLKLWGGTDPIKQALKEALRRRRVTAHLCIAPTALAALWLARHRQQDALSRKALTGRLSGLPLEVTGWPDSTRQLLNKMGVKTIGDCLRLPRDGLARRAGRHCLQELDRSLGEPDPRAEFEPGQRMRATVEFQAEITAPEMLAHAGQTLISRLARALQKRQAQVASLEFGFHHLRKPKTVQRIRLMTPTYESERISGLFVDKLETMRLPAPVVALSLATGDIEPMVGRNTTLFANRSPAVLGAAVGELIERLRLRFGTEAIYGIALIDEHRPEAAWSKSLDPLSGAASSAASGMPRDRQRPLWLLPAPIPLSKVSGGGALRLASGPERIEAGWWERRDVSRDYFIASGSQGEKLWIYRDRCSDRGWYLHGLFG